MKKLNLISDNSLEELLCLLNRIDNTINHDFLHVSEYLPSDIIKPLSLFKKELLEEYNRRQELYEEYSPKVFTYNPYKGPAGPTKQQTLDNTRFLGQELEKAQIPFKENWDYIKENYGGTGGDEMVLEINNGKDTIHVSYDRWGFVVDELEDFDQVDFIIIFKGIIKWYNEGLK